MALGTDTFTPIRAIGGGSGANAATWLAATGLETHFVGRVGDDVFGEFLERDLHGAGVRTHLTRDTSLATGKVFVLVDGAGDRTMVTDRGAGESLSPEDLPGSLFSAGHLHLSGYTFSGGSRRETATEALRLARESGMTVSVDPSSVPLLEDIGSERFPRLDPRRRPVFPEPRRRRSARRNQRPRAHSEGFARALPGRRPEARGRGSSLRGRRRETVARAGGAGAGYRYHRRRGRPLRRFPGGMDRWGRTRSGAAAGRRARGACRRARGRSSARLIPIICSTLAPVTRSVSTCLCRSLRR